jgi:peptidoglycan/LPS O-acetylase OafA/YrhL
MIKRLEQVAALVVAAGLALVSYWLFFSWAQGGGSDRRPSRQLREQGVLPVPRGESACSGIPGGLA